MKDKKYYSFHSENDQVDVNNLFRHYEFAIPEHEPIKLSNGQYLHTYRLTPYNDYYDDYVDGDFIIH